MCVAHFDLAGPGVALAVLEVHPEDYIRGGVNNPSLHEVEKSATESWIPIPT